ncbi:MAG: rod shape-determining protein MreC [Gammaproteobacteria bacterium]
MPIKTLFLKGPSTNVKAVLFILVSVALMIVDHRQGHLETVRSVLSSFVYPLQYAVNMPVKAGHWVSESFVTRKTLLEENNRLREEQLLLNSRLQRFDIIQEENNRLRELLESSARMGEQVLLAELIAIEMESFRRQVVINKGGRENVYNGQPVVDARGIMGQVIHVNPFSSTVLLITDPTHSMPVQINRNGLRAIAVGTGQDDVLLLENLPTNADIREGDLVISSGLGHRFPGGYPVGTVEKINIEPGEAFSKVSVTPSARLGQSREVLLIWPDEDDLEISKTVDPELNR